MAQFPSFHILPYWPCFLLFHPCQLEKCLPIYELILKEPTNKWHRWGVVQQYDDYLQLFEHCRNAVEALQKQIANAKKEAVEGCKLFEHYSHLHIKFNGRSSTELITEENLFCFLHLFFISAELMVTFSKLLDLLNELADWNFFCV